MSLDGVTLLEHSTFVSDSNPHLKYIRYGKETPAIVSKSCFSNERFLKCGYPQIGLFFFISWKIPFTKTVESLEVPP